MIVMKRMTLITIMMVLLASLVSCVDEGKPKEITKARSVGGTSEILLVTQNDEQWNGQMGQAVRDFFEQEQYGLPQPEKNFKVAHLNIDALSDMFQKHRNLIIAKIDEDIKNPLVETQKNWESEPQFVMRITASSPESWVRTFNSQKDGLKLMFDQNERERFQEFFRPTRDHKIISQMKKQFGVTMNVPEGYFIGIDKDDFMWIRKETADMSMAFLVYELPYKDTADLNPDNIIKVRDSIVHKYIPGPIDGSYMTTVKRIPNIEDDGYVDFLPQRKVIKINGREWIELRGFWEVEKDFMGGPFVSYTTLNERTGELFTLDCYVYSPKYGKRNFLRPLEHLVFGVTFPTKQ